MLTNAGRKFVCQGHDIQFVKALKAMADPGVESELTSDQLAGEYDFLSSLTTQGEERQEMHLCLL